MSILISGATGNVGSELVKILMRKGQKFRAMVRSPEKAGALASMPGAELVQGDFDNERTLANALEGIERAFLVTNSSERAELQQRAFVDAARRAGVRHIVKLSQWAADHTSPVRFLRYHASVEAAIRDSGMQFTFLRPNLFMQGLLGFRQTITANGQFFAAAGDARISAIDVRDLAEVAAAALVEPRHEDKVYNLTGPEALTHEEMAAQLASALGRPISFINVTPEAMREALLAAGLPRWQAEGLIEDYAHYRRGEAATVTSGVRDATGRSPRTFAEFAHDYASFFG